MVFCTEFKVVAAMKLGTYLRETREVKKNGCAKLRLVQSWVKTEQCSGDEARRKTDRRHDNLSEKLKTDSWCDLWETITMALLLRFG
jgi:hypothetical protein